MIEHVSNNLTSAYDDWRAGMTSHDELSYYLSQGLAIRVDGITISDVNLEHINLILNEDDSYMKEYVNDQEGEIYAIEYQKIKECKEHIRAGIMNSRLLTLQESSIKLKSPPVSIHSSIPSIQIIFKSLINTLSSLLLIRRTLQQFQFLWI